MRNIINKFAFSITVAIIMIAFVVVNPVKADVVTDGLVAYWSFDKSSFKGNDVIDVIGGNDGVLNGKPKEVAGKINQALEFDGTNSVDVAGTDALNFNGKEELSVAAWVKATADEPVAGVVAGCCGTIVAQRDANGWALRYDGRNPGNEYEFIVCPGWQGDGGFGAPMFEKNEWHYLTAVVAENKTLFYMDGELLLEGNFAGPISSNGSETDIGHASDGGFIGIIDEVLIYDRALEDDEVMQNYESKVFFSVDYQNKLAICWGDIKRK